MTYTYPAKIERDEDGAYIVTFPDFSYGATDGATETEALVDAVDLLRELLVGTIRDGEDIPRPSAARGRPMVTAHASIAAKAAFYQVVKESDLSVRATARRLNLAENEVRRMLNPAHVTKIDRLETALASFGQFLEVSVLEAS